MSRGVLQLLRDCDTRWSSTYFMTDRALEMLPVCFTAIGVYSRQFNSTQVIKTFTIHQDLSHVITVPSMDEVCVLNHIQAVMSVPHDAQESLSSERTPTLSYSLPFYHSIIDEWEYLKGVYPLLSPFIEIGVTKVEEYIDKSQLSRTYLLAIRKLPPLLNSPCTNLMPSVLNPCLKVDWVEENCSADSARRVRQMALEAVGPIQQSKQPWVTLSTDACIQEIGLGNQPREPLRIHYNSHTFGKIHCCQHDAFFGPERGPKIPTSASPGIHHHQRT